MFLKCFGVFFLLFFISLSLDAQSRKRTFSAKEIEKKMVKINDSLYACKYETSNGEYNYFLKELCDKDSALYRECIIDSLGWRQVLAYGEPMVLYYDRHPAFANFPVVNINYKGAVEYCRWLTDKYNNHSKRKFRKVLFMLPSFEEWVTAAEGNHSESGYKWRNYDIYPWGSDGLADKKGFYMCNFKPVGDPYYVRDSLGNPVIVNYEGYASLHTAEFPAEKRFYTMKINSFSPNDFGLYNTSGNAAEMINEPNKAMGGSWNSYQGEIRTTSVKQYKYPSPEVGFRVFMKIIQR